MRRPKLRSLRFQLAVVGLLAIIFPLLVLLSVVVATEDIDTVVDDRAGVVNEVEDSAVSPWVPGTVGLIVLPAVVVVWWWSGRAVRPLAEITSVAQEIQGGSLDRRIGLKNAASEVQALADSFDGMLERLERASTVQRRLVEDTSHEIRTPLAALAMNAEVMIANPNPTLDDYRQATERTQRSVARLQRTAESLLAQARTESISAAQVDNDLAVITRRVVTEQMAMPTEVTISASIPDTLLAGIDGQSVERAIGNLLDNATRFAIDGGPVLVEVGSLQGRAFVSVADNGPGIAPADQPHVFDRYWQSSSDASSGGSGIGLALVKQVADAHGGVEIESPLTTDGGSRFTLWFDI